MTPAPAVRAQPGEAGVILIAVLLAVALMSVMVVAVASLTRAGIGSERLEERRLATDLALRSALERGKALVLATPAERRAFFDGSAEEVELGQGLRARIAVQDVAGFVDLNGSDPALITAVAAAAGLGKAEAEALASRIDALRQQAAARPAPAAAKASLQQDAGGKAPPRPTIFLTVSQLGSLDPLDPDRAAALAARLTVYNPEGLVNPLAAPASVLDAVPGLGAADRAVIAAAKAARRWQGDMQLADLLSRFKPLLAVAEPRVFAITARIEAGEGVISGAVRRAVVMPAGASGLPFRTLAVEEQ